MTVAHFLAILRRSKRQRQPKVTVNMDVFAPGQDVKAVRMVMR